MIRVLFVLVLVLGCRGRDASVLEPIGADGGNVGDGAASVLTSCTEALATGRSGDPCLPLDQADCRAPDGCCANVASCESGLLVLQRTCEDCTECTEDAGCARGEWCIDDICVPCPAPNPPPACDGTARPGQRNGCETSVCLPASRCEEDVDCAAGAATRGTCVDGLACACEGEGCCVRVCADLLRCPTPTPHPEGCVAVCSALTCPEGRCRRIGCQCTERGWACAEECTAAEGPACGPAGPGR